jgi:DNA-binding SARP family transcriptional activator
VGRDSIVSRAAVKMPWAAKQSLSGLAEMEFRILGPLEVIGDDEPLPLGGVSQRALLALLLLHANEVVSNDRLLDELWEEPPASGLTAVQVRVSQLRKALGDEVDRLETKAPGYVFRVGSGELDLTRFSQLVEEAGQQEPAGAVEKLREALALWRGPALADVAYERFAVAATGRIEELRLTALELRIDAELALGHHSELVGELEALVSEHPLRERFRGQLMLALYRSGRQTEALAVYRATRRALVDELGIEPSLALQELERAILRQDPVLNLTRPERSILVTARGPDGLELLLALAEPLAQRPAKELILARLVSGSTELGTAAADLQERAAGLRARGISARSAAFVSTAPANDIVRLSTEQDVDLLLVDGPAELSQDSMLAQLLAGAPCDVAIVVGTDARLRRPGAVLVPFVGAEHDWVAVELAAWIAGALEIPLALAGPRESGNGRDASRLLANASLAVQRTLGIAAEPLLLEPGAADLLAAAERAALIVVGLSDRWQREGLGEVRAALVAAGLPVVLVKHGLRPGGLAPNESSTRFTWSIRA